MGEAAAVAARFRRACRESAVLTDYTPRGYIIIMEHAAKKKALRRLRIIKGQIAGLGRMIEADTYCIDLITQSSAIKRALSGIEDVVLESHLSTHAVMQMRSGQAKKAAAEILKVYQLSKKK